MGQRDRPLAGLVPMSAPSEYWRGRRVLVTGHSGFKGGWLGIWLHRLGARVTGFALPPPTEPNLFTLAGVDNAVDSHIGDVRDGDAFARVLDASAPEVVFHLAAQPLVRLGYARPLDTFATNLMGLCQVLDAIRSQPSVRTVIVVTSDKCYRNQEWPWPYRETDALGGHDPYSASKACQELAAAAWHRSYLSRSGDTARHRPRRQRHRRRGLRRGPPGAGPRAGRGRWQGRCPTQPPRLAALAACPGPPGGLPKGRRAAR